MGSIVWHGGTLQATEILIADLDVPPHHSGGVPRNLYTEHVNTIDDRSGKDLAGGRSGPDELEEEA